MTPKLRKIHRRVWLGMAVLLPATIFVAASVIPLPSPDKLTSEMLIDLQDKTMIGSEDGIEIYFGHSEETQPVLEIEITKPFEAASSLVTLSRSGENDILLGKLTGGGTTYFELLSGITLDMGVIHIDDVLRHKPLYSITLHQSLHTKN